VYDELVGFDNSEFFFVPVPPSMVNETFKEVCLHFDGAVIVGVHTASGEIHINPGLTYHLEETDGLIMIAESLDAVKVLDVPYYLSAYKKMPAILPEVIMSSHDTFKGETFLICGWRRDLRDVIVMLNRLVSEKSVLHILCDVPVHDRDMLLTDDGLDLAAVEMLDIVHFEGNSAVRRHLEQLSLETYSSIMIVADVAYENNALASDSHTLASLLLIRNIRKQRVGVDAPLQQSRCTVMCEFLDNRTSVMKNGDVGQSPGHGALDKFGGTVVGCVHSHEVTGRVLAMVSSRPQLKKVFDELLGYHGASLHVKDTARYARKREMVSFWTVAQRAWDYNEILIGRFHASSGVVEMNTPDKEKAVSWEGYSIICIAGNGHVRGRTASQLSLEDSVFARAKSTGRAMKSMKANQKRGGGGGPKR
jgi:hypothetical protein